jgi:hypothetical protein
LGKDTCNHEWHYIETYFDGEKDVEEYRCVKCGDKKLEGNEFLVFEVKDESD